MKLVHKLNPHLRPIVELAVLTGMRQSDLLMLRKAALDLKRRTLLLTRTKNNEVPTVYLHPDAVALLKPTISYASSALVFVSRRGKPYTADGFRSVFRRVPLRRRR